MSYAPCKNPNCKSFGSAHPNCRCYGGMADGGDVGFCNIARAHDPGCEYFAEGGEAVPESDLPSDLGEAVPLSDLPQTTDVGEAVPENDLPKDYGTIAQQLGTAAEGLAQGVAGPLATAAELGLSKLGVPGLSAEDIKGRQEANPWVHGISEAAGLAGSMLIGTGEAALAAKAAEAAAQATNIGKIGSSIVKGAITNGLIQGGDEVSKWMLGQGDPQESVGAKLAHVGAAGLFGGALGGAGSIASSAAKKGLEEIAEKQFGQHAEYWLRGVVEAAQSGVPDITPKGLAGVSKKAFMDGQKFFNTLTKHAGSGGALIEGVRGYHEDGALGAIKGAGRGYLEGLLLKKFGANASKIMAPALIKVLSGDSLSGALQALDHAAEIAKGSKAVTKSIEGLFGGAGLASQQGLKAYFSDKDRDKLDEYVKNGGITQQVQQQIYDDNEPMVMPGFADGGDVERPLEDATDGIAAHYPEQNVILNIAKGRVSNYLNSLRPQPVQPKLAFDDDPDIRNQEKSYKRALDIAAKPLSIIDEIKDGTVEPEHVRHFNSLYPEISGLLQKRLTERISKAQLDGEKPNYKIRQGLSMFMGTALSGELTPEAIQASQNVFAAKGQQQNAAAAPKSSPSSASKLTKSDQSYLTSGQALQRRAQKI